MAEGAGRTKVERPGGLPLSLGLPVLAPVPGDRLTEQEGLGIQLLLCVDQVLIEAQLPRSLSPWQRESCPAEAEPSTPACHHLQEVPPGARPPGAGVLALFQHTVPQRPATVMVIRRPRSEPPSPPCLPASQAPRPFRASTSPSPLSGADGGFCILRGGRVGRQA